MKKRTDGRWQKTKSIDGKLHYFYSNATSEKTATKDLEQQMMHFEKKDKRTIALRQIIFEWEQTHYETVSYKTVSEYTAMARRIEDRFGDRNVCDIKPLEIDAFIKDLAAKGLSKNTISTNLLIFKMILRHAQIKGYLTESPADCVRIPKNLPHHRRELPSDQTTQKIIHSINCHFGLFAYFILYTGLRKSEALALRWDDIDFENHLIHVNKVLTYQTNRPILRCHTKTEAGMRDVVLLDTLAEKLSPKGKGILFPDANGGYMSEQAYKRHWERYRRESGVDCTAHQIRHSYATLLYEAGIPDKDTQALMGHSDISVTRNIYQHIRQQKLDTSRTMLNKHIEKSEKTS